MKNQRLGGAMDIFATSRYFPSVACCTALFFSCFSPLLGEPPKSDEPLSKQSWSYFGPLCKHYILGRREKPDAVYSILKSYVTTNAYILDLGSGTGISTRQLYKNGFKNVIGVDRDALMIKEAQAANTKNCTIKYIQTDIALGLPFCDEQFDVVTAASAFHWFSNPSSIKEVARILKPNGYYFIVGGKSRYQESKKPNPIKETIEKMMRESAGDSLQEKPVLSVDVLEDLGFKIVVDATVPYSHQYTRDEYLHSIQSTSKWNLIPEDQKPLLLKKIGQYLDTMADKQGLIKKEGCVTVVLAQKI